MKKIAFLINTMGDGGAQKVISILLEYLMKHYKEKYKIYLILMENNNKYVFSKDITIKVLNKKEKTNLQKLLEIPLEAYKLKKYIKEQNIDIVYSMLYRANYLNVVAKLQGSKHKSFIGLRSSTSRYFNEGLKGKVNLFLICLLYRHADLIISNSNGVKSDFQDIFEFKNKHIVIYNPFEKCNCNDNTQNDLLSKDKKYIIAIGRMIPLKRFNDLITAYSKSNLIDDYDIVFLGDGQEKKRLIELSERYKLSEKIHFIGNVKNPSCYLQNSDIFVSSSETEGFPNALVEAMMCKNIVISSDCKSGPSEILDNGEIGFLYEVGNIEELIQKLNYVQNLSDSSKKELVENIYARATDFETEKVIDKLIGLLDEKDY